MVGAAVAGNLVAFGPDLTDQHRNDAINSLLFAQLVAGGQADRRTAPIDWYAAYEAALQNIAWVIGASTTTNRYLSQTPSFTLPAAVDGVLRSRSTSTDLSRVRLLLAAYNADVGGLAQLVFECPSHSGGLGNLQVALATEDADDSTLLLRIVRIFINAPTHVVEVMSESFTRDAKVQAGFVAMTLDEDAFAKLRAPLAKRLEEWLPSAVAPLQPA